MYGDLKCAFCAQSFPGFQSLGEHVQEQHPEIRRTLDGVKPPAASEDTCGDSDRVEAKVSRLVSTRISTLTQEVTAMAKKLALPEPDAGGQEYNPWLTPEALGKSGKGTLTITGNMRESSSQFGEGIVIDVRLGNANYSWTIKFSSGNYSRLVKRFGKNPEAWKGKVSVETKEYMGKEYVAVS